MYERVQIENRGQNVKTLHFSFNVSIVLFSTVFSPEEASGTHCCESVCSADERNQDSLEP